jgi:hypothetical protein
MNSKLIFLIVVLALLFGLIFIINRNRIAREKVRIEEKIHPDRQQFLRDSLQNIHVNNDKIGTDNATRSVANNVAGNTVTQNEDFSSYINSSITNSLDNTSVAVTVVDENGNVFSPISASIANIYTQTGNNGNTGLLRSSFIHKSGFQELFEGNSEIIEKLKLSSHTDYLALGNIRYSVSKGNLVDGTIICTASLTMSIISVNLKSIAKSFTFSENGNGVTETQAREAATEKLINKYYNEYSSL